MFYPPTANKTRAQINKPNQLANQAKKNAYSEDQICVILEMPPKQRSNKKHQIIWAYFSQMNFFQQIQKSKSIYAMIMAISLLKRQIKSNNNIKSPKHPFVHIFQNQYKAILDIQDYKTIINLDQSNIKRKLDKLKKYSIFHNLTYEQMLYVSEKIQEKEFKYKQFVYHCNQQPTELYLIEEGEFHYIKENKQQINHHQKFDKRPTNPKFYTQIEELHNKKAFFRKVIQRVAIIVGKLGLTAGEQEIIFNIQRKYSLICMSTHNLCLSLKKQILLCLLQGNDLFRKQILQKTKKKHQFKSDIVSRNETTRLHIQEYIKQISKNTQSNKINVNPRTDKNYKQIVEQNQPSSNLAQTRIKTNQDNNTKGFKKVKTFQTVRYTEGISENDNEVGFALTQVQYEKLNKKEFQNVNGQKKDSKQRQVNGSLNKVKERLPPIKQQQIFNYNDTIQMKKSKSISGKKSPHYLYNKAKGDGMINSETLVKEKLFIAGIINKKPQRQQLYPNDHQMSLAELQKAIIRAGSSSKYELPNINIKESKTKVSAAHSKYYMQKLLLNVLEKSGYETKDSHENKQKNNKTKLVKKKKINHVRGLQIQVLQENNEFDKCYFKEL